MSDSEMADSEMVSSGSSSASNYIPELNCLMRYNDDYLLLTTSKNNACLFIEKMKKLSEDSNFKFLLMIESGLECDFFQRGTFFGEISHHMELIDKYTLFPPTIKEVQNKQNVKLILFCHNSFEIIW